MNGLRFVPAQADVKEPDVFVQGVHYPAMLVEKSGVWIKHAGSAMLSAVLTAAALRLCAVWSRLLTISIH